MLDLLMRSSRTILTLLRKMRMFYDLKPELLKLIHHCLLLTRLGLLKEPHIHKKKRKQFRAMHVCKQHN